MQQLVNASHGHSAKQRVLACLAVLATLQGCAAFHPVRGVPASYVSDEMLTIPREGSRQIDPSLLVRMRPDQHRVEGGDILTIFVPGVLGSRSTEVNEVGINPPINLPTSAEDPPTVGFPVQVRDDHTISLPQIQPLNVRGMTLNEVEAAIRRAYTVDHQILRPEEAMILVSLFRAREYRVLIFRQEFSQEIAPQTGAGSVNFGKSRKGTARQVRLKAGENDVAHALTLAGVDGLPGNDAENMIYIIRHPKNRAQSAQPTALQPTFAGPQSGPVYQSQPSYAPQQMGYPQQFAPQQLQPQDAHLQNLQPRPIQPGPLQSAPVRPIDWTSPRPNTYGNIDLMSAEAAATENSIQRADYSYDAHESKTSASRVQLIQHSFSPGAQGSSGSYGSPDLSGIDHAPSEMIISPQSGPSQRIAGYTTPARRLPSEHSLQPAIVQPPYQGIPTQQGAPMSQVIPVQQVVPAPSVQQMLAPFSAQQALPLQPIPMAPEGYGMPQSMPISEVPGTEPLNDGYASMWGQFLNEFDPTIDNPNVIKIPVRIHPGEGITFTEQDITLYDGDIIFIESRETEVFYTGGLLGGGQYPIPRDYDLHILEAISIAESRSGQQAGQATRTIGGVSALNQDVGGSASRVLILRKLPNGQRARIEVNIYKAMVRDEENLLIQPGDFLILQYTFPEACAAFTQRFLLEGALIGIATSTFTGGGGGGG